MQKLLETLKEFGIEVPQDKQAELKTALSKHYKNASEHEKTLGKVTTERDSWKQRAETAEETLKSFEGIDPANINAEIANWKKKAEDAEANAKKQIYERDFNDALKAEFEGIKFSSEAAKRDVMAQVKEKGLKLSDGKILGLSDLISQIKEKDATAFVDDSQVQAQQKAARFTTPASKQHTPGTMTKKDIEAIKDPSERQAAIASNLHLFGKTE